MDPRRSEVCEEVRVRRSESMGETLAGAFGLLLVGMLTDALLVDRNDEDSSLLFGLLNNVVVPRDCCCTASRLGLGSSI